MLYNINNFPEGTKITQSILIESDLYRNSDMLIALVNADYQVRTNAYSDISPFISYCDLSSVEYFEKALVFRTYTHISGNLIQLGKTGGELILDLPNCKSFNQLPYTSIGNLVLDKVIFRNLKPTKGFKEVLYQYDTKEMVFDNCEFASITYLLDNKSSIITKISPVVLSSSHSISNFCYNAANKLTDFGGLINLKQSITSNGFNNMPNLTYESCINILNGLYDFVGNGETPTSTQGKLKVHQNFLNLVGDEISIGTNKGWTITA